MSQITLIIGTYTGGLIGFKGPLASPSTSFAFSVTTNCVKSLKIQDDKLIVGGFDEILRIFSLSESKEMGAVLENLGSINVIESCKSHTITGSEQGKITIWRNKDWVNLHSFKGHRNSITGLAIHPSNRMAISSGRDRRLYLWNLVKARPSFKCRLDRVLENLSWSPCGLFYIGHTERELRIFSVESNAKEDFLRFEHRNQIISAGFLGCSSCFFLADLIGEIVLFALGKGKIGFSTGKERMCKVVFLDSGERKLMVSASTTGEVKIWNITSAVKALQGVKKGDEVFIDNADEMVIFSVDVECRVSALASVIS